MTGAYLRIERDGKYLNLEVEYLTDDEREFLFRDRSREELMRWFNMVCDVLKTTEEDISAL